MSGRSTSRSPSWCCSGWRGQRPVVPGPAVGPDVRRCGGGIVGVRYGTLKYEATGGPRASRGRPPFSWPHSSARPRPTPVGERPRPGQDAAHRPDVRPVADHGRSGRVGRARQPVPPAGRIPAAEDLRRPGGRATGRAARGDGPPGRDRVAGPRPGLERRRTHPGHPRRVHVHNLGGPEWLLVTILMFVGVAWLSPGREHAPVRTVPQEVGAVSAVGVIWVGVAHELHPAGVAGGVLRVVRRPPGDDRHRPPAGFRSSGGSCSRPRSACSGSSPRTC